MQKFIAQGNISVENDDPNAQIWDVDYLAIDAEGKEQAAQFALRAEFQHHSGTWVGNPVLTMEMYKGNMVYRVRGRAKCGLSRQVFFTIEEENEQDVYDRIKRENGVIAWGRGFSVRPFRPVTIEMVG